jgi:glycolate dehydrogenase FAD-binding subunit
VIHTGNEFSLCGMYAAEIFSPCDAAELARVLAECNHQKRAVVPWGGGTLQHLGSLPTRYDVALQTTNLNQVVEYAYDDLTITVGAGMTLAEIGRVLSEHGQFLPIDVPHPERATIGGVLAAGMNGPLRLRYGPARDFMLGNRFATVEGQIIKAGSKVVKNVAGYELHKVMVGSLGTLGILTEATFKIFPRPPAELILWAAFEYLTDASAAISQLWQLVTPPLAVELFDEATARLVNTEARGLWHVAVRFGGSPTTMAAARELSIRVVEDKNALSANASGDMGLWRAIADLPATLAESAPDALQVRVSIPPKELTHAVRVLVDVAAAHQLKPPRLFAHACVASVYASLQGEAASFKKFVPHLRAQLDNLHGRLVIENVPTPVRREIDAWDDVGASLRLMQSIKRNFDPNNILNPGRYVGGI